MAITTSRAGTVVDAIYTLVKANATFSDPTRVYDGPVTTADTEWTNAVYIGFDGDWNGTFESVLINQQLVYLGDTTVREELEVRCFAEAWSGDPAVKTNRDLLLSLLAAVETVLRTDPTLGIDGSTIATLQVGSLYQQPFQDGIVCRAPFVVHVLTTLLTV